MADTLAFTINGNRNMDILTGIHGSFSQTLSSSLMGGYDVTVLSDYGEMLFQGIQLPFGEVWLSHYRMQHDAHLAAEANTPSLELMHLLEGETQFSPEGLTSPVSMKNSHWQIMHLPYVANRVSLGAGSKITTLDFHFKRDWLDRMTAYYKKFAIFLEKADRGEPAILSPACLPMPPEVNQMVSRLFSRYDTPAMQIFFMERNAMNWLASNLESPFLEDKVNIRITPEERKRMEELRDYMIENFQEEMTNQQLADMVFINIFRFGELFKMLFGASPRQYLIEYRLQKVREMVEKGRHSISEISALTGYGSHAAMTKEFTKHFGSPPSAFRRR